MPATATLVGGGMGFAMQLYINALRKLPLLRSACPRLDTPLKITLILLLFFSSRGFPPAPLLAASGGQTELMNVRVGFSARRRESSVAVHARWTRDVGAVSRRLKDRFVGARRSTGVHYLTFSFLGFVFSIVGKCQPTLLPPTYSSRVDLHTHQQGLLLPSLSLHNTFFLSAQCLSPEILRSPIPSLSVHPAVSSTLHALLSCSRI